MAAINASLSPDTRNYLELVPARGNLLSSFMKQEDDTLVGHGQRISTQQ
jgi:hypothetical protein